MIFLYYVSLIPINLLSHRHPLAAWLTHINHRLPDCESFEGAEIVEDTVSEIKLVATWKILLFWIASNAFDISDIH